MHCLVLIIPHPQIVADPFKGKVFLPILLYLFIYFSLFFFIWDGRKGKHISFYLCQFPRECCLKSTLNLQFTTIIIIISALSHQSGFGLACSIPKSKQAKSHYGLILQCSLQKSQDLFYRTF